MSELEAIRRQVKELYNKNPHIHIDISSAHVKTALKNTPAELIGVYPHIFRVEVKNGEEKERYTLQYTDILIKQAVIAEMNIKM